MKQTSQLYEGMYIISATLSEEARKKTMERITSGIEAKGGEIKNLVEWGRRKLAYRIGGHRREGIYTIVYFTIDPAKMPEIWDEYKLNEDLLRFMTLKTDCVRDKIQFKPFYHGE